MPQERFVEAMSQLDPEVVTEVVNWVSAKRALKVAKNLVQREPDNVALKTRLMQTTHDADEAQRALKAALQRGGFTAAQLQEHLRRMAG